jgi:threonine dehydratase
MATKLSLWDYADQLLPSVVEQFRLTLGEGHTPLEQHDGIYFKREDYNPTGSHKDRGFAFQLSALLQQGHRDYVLSSSGNAAISAARYCRQSGTRLTVFVSSKTNIQKLNILQSLPITINQDPRPVTAAFRFAKQTGAYNLRPSKDALGPVGYQTLAYELLEQLPDISTIFMPVSSGTTLTGLAQGFDQVKQKVALFAVQTTAIHPIASAYDQQFHPEDTSIADAIVAKSVPRKKQIQHHLQHSGGGAWVVSNQQIQTARDWLKQRQVTTSNEGATALAGYFKAIEAGQKPESPVVCLLTGQLR